MRQSERHREIMRILEHTPLATVEDLCRSLGASPATVRRDLRALAEDGRINRIHGGAEPKQAPGRLQGTPFSRNVLTRVPEKKAIAKRAAELCADGEAIIMDAGSTTYFMCPHLRGRDLQVLTNSIPIVEQLLGEPSVRLHVPGGEIFREQNIVLSPFDNNGVNQYAASKMFMGAGALSARGLLQSDSILIQAEQRLMARADELIVLADSTKFDADASLILCPLGAISRLVTDAAVRERDVQMIERAGITVDIVDPLRP